MRNIEKNYVGLHNHSHYSLLDGFATVDEYINAAKSMNMIGVGLTDHGTAAGLYEFITKAQSNGLIPIPGVEFYVAPENPDGAKVQKAVYYGPNGNRAPKYDVGGNGAHLHMTVIAYNNKGLENLFKLSTLSWQPEHYYYKPRIDINMLAEHSEGLIVTTGCPSSEINKRFLLKQDRKAYEYAERLKGIFGDNFYVEIMNHNMDEDLEKILLPKLLKLAKDLNLPLLGTNDSHYAYKENASSHERLLAVQSASVMSELGRSKGGTRFDFSGPEYHLKSYEEMYSLYPEDIAEEALANTIKVAEQCANITLEYDPHLRPVIDIPEGFTNVTYLQKLINDGFKAKRKMDDKETQAESMRRIKEEFEVLHSNDFIDYFLVVHDYIDFAHKNGISLGAGRGSVGGSEIAYVLNISDTDPIRYDLLFERFLSPGRGSLYHIDYDDGTSEEISVSEKKVYYNMSTQKKETKYIHELAIGNTVDKDEKPITISNIYVSRPGSAPDVDTDFHTQGREKVIEYVSQKYGKENVANIVTFGTFGSKSAFKTMCTIYQKPFALANNISAMIPDPIDGKDAKIADLLDEMSMRYNEGEDFRNAISDGTWDEVIEHSIAIDGRIRNTGVHPCGVIISSVPLSGVVPTQIRQNDGAVVTQWPYPQLESMGLIKMDFLGLENIDIVDATLENIRTIGKEVPDMSELTRGEMDDKKVYEMLGRGDTVGIFQMASPGVRALLQKAQPTKFMDIATITALYRPGPMSTGAHNTWADRLNGSEEVKPLHPEFAGTAVEDILADTAGLVVFQEQLMRIATNFAGMTPYESELLRKAMGKKNMKIMMEMQPKFIEGSIESGVSEEAANLLWDTLEGFGQYGFNKCLASRTLISTENGKVRLEDLYKMHEAGEDIYINSMFEDGEIKLHQVKEIVKSGRKPLYQVVTESGKKIRLTKEHRLLTTNGYGTIEDGGIAIGNSLITDDEWSKRISPATIKLRKETMSDLNRTDFMREQSRQNMTDYQATLTFEDRSEHQKMISETTDRSDKVLTIARERLEKLRKDPEWQASFIDACAEAREKKADSKEYKGFGKVTTLSNGMICDSLVEAAAGEYLISRGVDFEVHKKITNKDGVVKVSDFYANGIYFEMDGLNRGPEYFREHKYGDDIPFVHMTPLNYKDKIDEALMNHHAKNGDKIVAIIEPKVAKNGKQYTEMTYDIEMMDNGPSNFIADGIVSHNSHSISYAINAYKNMYLKANYPAEYMAAVIQQKSRDSRTVSQFIQEATNMGLILGPVDINTSQVHVAPTKKGTSDYDIVYGFAAIKQVNLQLAHEIVTERNEHGPYKSVADFAKRITARTKMSSLALANIALAGGFDQFGVSRKMVVEKASNLLSSGNKTASKGVSLFDMIGSSEGDLVEAIELIGEEYSYNEKIKLEADRIGLFISGHPTSELGVVKNSFNSISVSELMKRSHGSEGKVIATFTTINSKTNRQGRRSMEVILDDGSDSMTLYLPKEVIAKSEKFIELQRINQANERGNELKSTKRSDAIAWAMEDESIVPLDLQENDVYLVSLRTRGFGENIKLGITDIERIDTMHNGSLPYKIVVKDNEEYDKIIDILKDNPGETYIECFVEYENETRYTEPINLTRELIMQLERLVGYDNIITQGV